MLLHLKSLRQKKRYKYSTKIFLMARCDFQEAADSLKQFKFTLNIFFTLLKSKRSLCEF
jgi:hypothetical protein